MPEPYTSVAIGLVELALALLVFTRAMPAAREMGFWHVVKFWCLGLCLGLFGVGRLFGPTYESAVFSPIFAVGHAALIAYSIARLVTIAHNSQSRWGRHL